MDITQCTLLPRFKNDDTICRFFEIAKDDLNVSLTHHSSTRKHNNSRYVFLGMYAFKGILSQWIFENIGGSGTQLQHYYGNISSNSYLQRLFDLWQLERYIHFGEGIKPQEMKHIFVLGFIGMLMEAADPKRFEAFWKDFFIAPNDHLLPAQITHSDDWQKLLFLTAQHGKPRPKSIYSYNETEKLHRFIIEIGGKTVATHSSISYRYAKKKTWKLALKALIEEVETPEMKSRYDAAEVMLKQQKAVQKMAVQNEKQQKWLLKNAEKQLKKAERNKQKKEAARQRDIARRKAKQQATAKKTKEKSTIYRDYTAEEIAAMNPGKRRRLEDLGIIW